MRRLTARTVMTTDVITTTVSTPVKDVVRLMDQNHVSALPVVDDGELVGLVSEGDLIVKQGYADDREPPGWSATPGRREVYAKVGAEVAGDLMTSPVVTIGPIARLTQIARTMADAKVKRLPVVDDGRLVGIISRSDLIRAYLRSDDDIRTEVEELALTPSLPAVRHTVTVDVADGVVFLQGSVELRSSAELVADAVGSIDGVVDVVNELIYERDDSVRFSSAAPAGE